MYLAIDVFGCRSRYKEAHANPLRKQYFDKSGDNEVLNLEEEEKEE